jgi:hypothetical protein
MLLSYSDRLRQLNASRKTMRPSIGGRRAQSGALISAPGGAVGAAP